MPEPAQVPLNEIPIVPIAEISGKLLDRGELVNLAEYAARRAEKFGQTIASLEAGIAARAADAAKSAQAAGFAPDLQRQAADKTAAKARAEVTAASDEARWGTLRELNAAAESLALTATLFASPVVVLSRAGLGTPERSAYLEQVRNAGPTELANLAAFAIASKNRTLAAALVSVVDAMPARSRPFSAHDLAEKLVGEEQRAVMASVEAIRTAYERALVANRNFQNNRANPIDKVKLALRARNQEND